MGLHLRNTHSHLTACLVLRLDVCSEDNDSKGHGMPQHSKKEHIFGTCLEFEREKIQTLPNDTNKLKLPRSYASGLPICYLNAWTWKAQYFENSGSHFIIPGVKKMSSSKFHTKDSQILGATVKRYSRHGDLCVPGIHFAICRIIMSAVLHGCETWSLEERTRPKLS